MATSSGISAQLAIGAEVTFDTYAAPTRAYEFVDDSLKLEIERIESKGLRPTRRTIPRWSPGVQRVTGDINMEFSPEYMGLILKHAFGGLVTTGASDPYTHTFTPGTLDDKSLTIQVGRPDIGGTVRAFSYTGCSIASWELTCSTNEYAMLKLSIYGADEVTSQSLVDVSSAYPATVTPLPFTTGSLTVAGSAFDVKSFKLKGDNGLKTDRHFIRATTPGHPKKALEASRREYTGELKCDFTDLTAYNRFVNGTEAALVITLSSSSSRQLVVTMNVRYDGNTPPVTGDDLLELTLPFKAVSTSSDAAAITAVLKNGDSTA